MGEIKRITVKEYLNLDPWETCGQDDYCKRGCHEEGGCTNGCMVPYIYRSLAMREDYEQKHGLKLVYGYNLLLLNNNENIANVLNTIDIKYKYEVHDFSNMTSFSIIKDEDTIVDTDKLCIFNFRPIKYSGMDIKLISDLLVQFMQNHPNMQIIIIEDKDKRIPQIIRYLSDVALEQVTENNYKIIKSFPMKYDNNSYIDLKSIL